MTRKMALKAAIEVINNADIEEETKKNITEKLELCIQELPFAKWSEAAIFDACDQFIAEHGRPLHLRDFVTKELPSHPTVKNRFGMTLKEFRDTYYPLPEERAKKPTPTPEETIESFRKEFLECGAETMEEYDRLRSPGAPHSLTVIKYSGAGTWLKLLEMAGLSPKRTAKRKGLEGYSVSMHFQFEDKISNCPEEGGDEIRNEEALK